MKALRNAVKYVVQSINYTQFKVKAKSFNKPTLYILTYHRTLPLDDPRRNFEQPGMMIAPEHLKNHIHWLKEAGGNPISLTEWGDKRDTLKPGLYFAVTFDDGWKDNQEYVTSFLASQEIHSTIFLVADYISTDFIFWPEKLLYLLKTTAANKPEALSHPQFNWLRELGAKLDWSSPPDTEELDPIINLCKSLDEVTLYQNINATISSTLESSASLPITHQLVSDCDIKQLLSTGFIQFGSHTCRHSRLDKLHSKDELKYEVVESKRKISQLTDTPTDIFCYPNGSMSNESQALVDANYVIACTTVVGNNQATTPLLRLKRHNLHDGNAGTKLSFFSTLSKG
ncbi:polysaccharide deacetylase family protein [Hahella sp. NBU794]|uniref:polysaccharide deacetylase family protein n=1 Tax=Hahella sp. NBU794 TaxID=3422590 RepID=UPI003D6F6EFF